MTRPAGYLSLFVAVASVLAAVLASRDDLVGGDVAGLAAAALVTKLLSAAAVVLGGFGRSRLLLAGLSTRVESTRRRHDLRNVVRFVFVSATAIERLGVLTESGSASCSRRASSASR